jgi:hypothetical protein
MFSKSKIRKIVLLLLLFWYSVELAQAGEQIVLSPQDGHSNQRQINDALLKADEVYLTSGIYKIDDSIFIDSDTILRGDPDAIIQVWEGSDQFFTGTKGLICSNGPVDNILIEGFQIDGNCDELPRSYADSAPQYDHDAERAIIINGYTNQFCNNITIRSLKIYDCFSDGVHIRFARDVFVSDNFISNCQHEGVFFTSIINGYIFNNRIAGITSDNIRCDNCVNNKVYKNVLFSYRGSNSNGAYQGGQNGIQVANAGSSHGYDASNKPTKTTNVEVFDNIFANDISNAIWVHSLDESQVYLHDNKRIDGSELADMGIPIEGIDYNNMPTKEMSEKVFSSIFDILDVEFTDSGRTGQTSDSFSDRNFKKYETTQGIVAGYIKIIGFKDVVVIDDVPYIPDKDAILTKSRVVRSPDLMGWAGHIKKIDKKETVEIKDGIAYTSLKVETSWYTIKTNTLTGEKKKSKIKTSNAVFEDSAPAYDILKRDTEAIVYAHVFKDTKNPVTRINTPVSDSIQKIEITYGENSSTRLLMLGERAETDEGLIYTTMSRCDIRTGSIPFMGDEYVIYGDFNPSKLHVEYFTPYESFPAKVVIVEHKKEERGINVSMFSFLAQLIMALYAGYKIMDIAFN